MPCLNLTFSYVTSSTNQVSLVVELSRTDYIGSRMTVLAIVMEPS